MLDGDIFVGNVGCGIESVDVGNSEFSSSSCGKESCGEAGEDCGI